MLSGSPMLQVADVEASSAWYQRLVGLTSGHGGPHYEMLFAGEPHASAMLLQLHRADASEHGWLTPSGPVGSGVSLWFQVADRAALDAAFGRAHELGAAVLADPAWNPLAHHVEFAVRDPDGYVVVVCTPFDQAGG